MSEAGGNPPAGWYPDSSQPGTQRYWDGAQWTEHTAPLADSGQAVAGQAASGPSAGSAGAPAENIDTWLWQSIVATLLCCLPLGVVGIVFSAQAQSAMNVGNYEEARNKAGTARTMTLIAVGVGLAAILIWVLFFFVGVGGALSGL